MSAIKITFTPGWSFDGRNDSASRADRCDAAASFYGVKAEVAARRGKRARQAAMQSMEAAYQDAADDARHAAAIDPDEAEWSPWKPWTPEDFEHLDPQ